MKSGTWFMELGLRVLAGLSALWALLWVLGYNGLQVVKIGQLPDFLQGAALWRGADWATAPSALVGVLGPNEPTSSGLFDQVNGISQGAGFAVPDSWGEIVPGSIAQFWDPSVGQRIAYVAAHALPALALVILLIMLSKLVATSQSESPFTLANARRLQWLGVALLIGAPLISIAQWASVYWIGQSSSIDDQIAMFGYGWDRLPYFPIVMGAVVLVLASVWKHGVRMSDDVAGLV